MKTLIVALALLVAQSVSAQVVPSLENTRIPPGTITDAKGYKWGLNKVYPNDKRVGAALDIDQMVYCKGVVYGHRISNNQWYRGTVGAGWTLVGKDPCAS